MANVYTTFQENSTNASPSGEKDTNVRNQRQNTPRKGHDSDSSSERDRIDEEAKRRINQVWDDVFGRTP